MMNTLTPNDNMALAIYTRTNMQHKEIAEACYISSQKLSALIKWHNTNSLLTANEYGKIINKNYILTRDGYLFSLLTNAWIVKTDNGCYRMNIGGNRIKKSANALVQKHFGKK